MPTSVFDSAVRKHALLDRRYPEARLYVQHSVSGRWGDYLRTNYDGTVIVRTLEGPTVPWDLAAICASVVTPRRIW